MWLYIMIEQRKVIMGGGGRTVAEETNKAPARLVDDGVYVLKFRGKPMRSYLPY